LIFFGGVSTFLLFAEGPTSADELEDEEDEGSALSSAADPEAPVTPAAAADAVMLANGAAEALSLGVVGVSLGTGGSCSRNGDDVEI
jgi:hypothetical protein